MTIQLVGIFKDYIGNSKKLSQPEKAIYYHFTSSNQIVFKLQIIIYEF